MAACLFWVPAGGGGKARVPQQLLRACAVQCQGKAEHIPGKPLARADILGQPGGMGWDGMGFPSTAVWGVMAVWDAAGDPRGAPARSLSRSRCGLGGISSPRAAEAVAPLPVCDSGRELREGRGEADGGWWVVVCFN